MIDSGGPWGSNLVQQKNTMDKVVFGRMTNPCPTAFVVE